jgi:hypothetical protein
MTFMRIELHKISRIGLIVIDLCRLRAFAESHAA